MEIIFDKSLLESLDKNVGVSLSSLPDGEWISGNKFAIHYNNHVQARVVFNPETDKILTTHGTQSPVSKNCLSQENFGNINTNPTDDNYILETPDNYLRRGSKENRSNTTLLPRIFLDPNGENMDDEALAKRYLQAAIDLATEPAISYYIGDGKVDPDAEMYSVVGIKRVKNYNIEESKVYIKLMKMNVPGVGTRVVSVVYKKGSVPKIVTYYVSNWYTYAEWLEHDTGDNNYLPLDEDYKKTKLRKQIKESLTKVLNSKR